MRGIFVDINNELANLAEEVALLAEAVEVYERGANNSERAWRWLAIQGLASGIEKIYSGCERVMNMIATEIDGAKVDRGDGWHLSLLKRVAHPYPGIRKAVIS